MLNASKGGPSLPEFSRNNIKVELETGIANGLAFDYIEDEVLDRVVKQASQQAFSMLDFFCVARYYLVDEKSLRALRFDYYMLRFRFGEREMELRVYHEKSLGSYCRCRTTRLLGTLTLDVLLSS